jgi:S1-C subfamily serine protease
MVSDNSDATNGGQGGDNGYFGAYGDQETGVSGATVSGVVDGGPAAKAGLTAGDTITQIGSQTVTSADDVSGLLATYKAGDKITIHWVDTDGASHRASVTLAASPVA